jgi:hypothetical protein
LLACFAAEVDLVGGEDGFELADEAVLMAEHIAIAQGNALLVREVATADLAGLSQPPAVVLGVVGEFGPFAGEGQEGTHVAALEIFELIITPLHSTTFYFHH